MNKTQKTGFQWPRIVLLGSTLGQLFTRSIPSGLGQLTIGPALWYRTIHCFCLTGPLRLPSLLHLYPPGGLSWRRTLKNSSVCTSAVYAIGRGGFIPHRYECIERWNCRWISSHWSRSRPRNIRWIRRRRNRPSTPEAEGKIRGILLLSFAFMDFLCIYIPDRENCVETR